MTTVKASIAIDIKGMPMPGVLNKLFKMTSLQTSFSVNNIALVKGRPKCQPARTHRVLQ